MARTFELVDCGIPDGSEYHRLLGRCPDIAPLCFEDGEPLVNEGDSSKDIFIVLRGICAVEHADGEGNHGGKPEPLAVIETADPGMPSFVGEIAYLGGGRRSATVRSAGNTYTLRLTPEDLDVIMEEFPIFTRILCRQFALRLREAIDALIEDQHLFATEAVEVSMGPGEVLCAKGHRADTLYQLLDGSLVRQVDGEDRPLSTDDLFLNFVDPLPYFLDGTWASTVKTAEATRLLSYPIASKVALARSMPHLLINCLREATRT